MEPNDNVQPELNFTYCSQWAYRCLCLKNLQGRTNYFLSFPAISLKHGNVELVIL